MLANATKSSERLADEYHQKLSDASAGSTVDLHAWLSSAISSGLGIHDTSDAEIQELLDHPPFAAWIFADIISRRSQTGWSTHGHSALDVNIYASDPQAAAALVGNHENTEVGKFLRDYLNVDVDEITKELRQKGAGFDTVDAMGEKVSWMGKLPESGQRLDGQDHLDHYQVSCQNCSFERGFGGG